MPDARKKKFPGVRRLKGSYDARGLKIAIVVSQFNEYLTNQLLDGALDTLVRSGAREKDVRVAYVPGAFEIPLVARKLIASGKPDAVIALAIVIRGETKHFDQVVNGATAGLVNLSKEAGIPVILGMIPAENVKQAIDRVGVKHTNKGREWALAAIETANLCRGLEPRGRKGKR